MKNLLLFFVSLLFFACTESTTGLSEKLAPVEQLRSFVESGSYKISRKKTDIPAAVAKYIPSRLGDYRDRVSLGCTRQPGGYTKRLNFVMLNDSYCVVSYKTGTIGTYNKLLFVKYNGADPQLIYTAIGVGESIESLKYSLREGNDPGLKLLSPTENDSLSQEQRYSLQPAEK